jgi:hypothetical protein
MQSRRRDYLGRLLKDLIPSLPLGTSTLNLQADSRPFIPKSKIPTVADVGLHFTINGEVKQSGTAADMIFPVPKLISFVSSIMRLEVCL